MSDVPVVQAFPKRPIAIKVVAADVRRRRLMLVGALLLFLPLVWYGNSTLQRWSLRADLRERGVTAEVLNAEGSCLSRRGVSGDTPRGCDYDIRYAVRPEHGGGEREASVYLPGAPPLVFAPSVLYDPQDPSRVMTERAVQQDDRIVDIAIPTALLTLMPLLALLVWFATGKGALVKAAAAPRPAIVAIERAVRRQNRLEIWFRKPDGKGQGMRSFPKGGPLLVAPPPGAAPDKQWALALLNLSGYPILLDEELAELELTEAERGAIYRAARG
ncbi:hypothetical protein D3874_14910 [Oleomonas cavernae]|uniref:DUF3592 domain-containing protein n=1 Tax=Oleomonas cavernae TaxID=2320859 RepID=A0A418WDP0_9PROT|nr:hypothetical protein [Oleomonas cavernae]RJF88147.1 hypothetical protein D3874_14910 [Oleomonas cavernae]